MGGVTDSQAHPAIQLSGQTRDLSNEQKTPNELSLIFSIHTPFLRTLDRRRFRKGRKGETEPSGNIDQSLINVGVLIDRSMIYPPSTTRAVKEGQGASINKSSTSR